MEIFVSFGFIHWHCFILQIKLDGSWFQLTDSMAVEAAFEWVVGPRRLLVEAHELGSDPVARKDAKCGTADSEPNAGHPVVSEDPSQYMLPHAEAPGGGNHASDNGASGTRRLKNQQDKCIEPASAQLEDGITMSQESSDLDLTGDNGTPLASQEDKPQECVDHASAQPENGITRPQESSYFDLAAGKSDTSLVNQEDKLQGCVERASVQLEVGNTVPQESSHVDLAEGDNDTPLANQEDKLQGCVEHASVKLEDGITMPQESSHVDLATGANDTLLPNQEDKPQGCCEYASGQLEDGVTTPHQESSDFDLAAGYSDIPMNEHDKFHGCAEHDSGCSEDRTTMPQERSDLGVGLVKENDCAGDQQKDIIGEPRGKKRFREEDKVDGNNLVNCDDNLSSLTSPTPKFVSEKKGSVIEQAKLDNGHLLCNLKYSSHGLLENSSGGEKEQWTSSVWNGESFSKQSACAKSIGKDKSSDLEVTTQKGDKEPQIAGCSSKSSCKRTHVPHYVKPMNEDNKGPSSHGHYLDKVKFEGGTSTVSKEHEPCIRRSHHRVVVRKVAMSRAMKDCSFR